MPPDADRPEGEGVEEDEGEAAVGEAAMVRPFSTDATPPFC